MKAGWQRFAVGLILLLVAIVLAFWGFSKATLSDDQRQILLWALPLASGFSASAFAGSLTVKAKGLLPSLAITATSGFGVWVLSFFLLFPKPHNDSDKRLPMLKPQSVIHSVVVQGVGNTVNVDNSSRPAEESGASLGIKAYLQQNRPYLEPKILIQSIESNHVHYRYEIENKGHLPAYGIKFREIGPNFLHADGNLAPLIQLAPGATMSHDFGNWIMDPLEGDWFHRQLDIRYLCDIGETNKEFSSLFKYSMPVGSLKSASCITYDSCQEPSDSHERFDTDSVTNTVLDALNSPSGVIMLIPREWGEFKTNRAKWFVSTTNRFFAFDAEKMTASFLTVKSNSTVIGRSAPFQTNRSGLHVVILNWSPTNASLSVDNTNSDFPPHLKLVLATVNAQKVDLELTNDFFFWKGNESNTTSQLQAVLLVPIRSDTTNVSLGFMLTNDAPFAASEVELLLTIDKSLNCIPNRWWEANALAANDKDVSGLMKKVVMPILASENLALGELNFPTKAARDTNVNLSMHHVALVIKGEYIPMTITRFWLCLAAITNITRPHVFGVKPNATAGTIRLAVPLGE